MTRGSGPKITEENNSEEQIYEFFARCPVRLFMLIHNVLFLDGIVTYLASIV